MKQIIKRKFPLPNLDTTQIRYSGSTHRYTNDTDYAESLGVKIYAPCRLKVISKKPYTGGSSEANGIYFLDIENDVTIRWAHMDNIGFNLYNVGDIIEKGELMGIVGNTGKSTGPHIHESLCHGAKTIRDFFIEGFASFKDSINSEDYWYVDENETKIIQTLGLHYDTEAPEIKTEVISKIKITKSSYKNNQGYAVRPYPYSTLTSYLVKVGTEIELVDILSFSKKAEKLDYAYGVLKDGNYIQLDFEYMEFVKEGCEESLELAEEEIKRLEKEILEIEEEYTETCEAYENTLKIIQDALNALTNK